MKIIIIEGTDNTGKDTLISKVSRNYGLVAIKHFGKPIEGTSEDQAKYQDKTFMDFMQTIPTFYNFDALILNRSWYGEYVYGTLYRERSKTDVAQMIQTIEKDILYDMVLDNSIKVAYITLVSNNSNLQSKIEDGLSLSQGDTEKISKEAELFKEIHNLSILPVKHIVNVADENGNFRTKESIYDEVMGIIGN